ncbi:hypothetical protein HY449_04560 [Candidatus Pacearchaeota archaeon]|nr:hypothetical protein [Candidatus Pacearchaeota archaeon]
MGNLISRLGNAGRRIAVVASLAGALAVAGCGELERQACLSNNFRDLEKPKGKIAEVLDCEKKNQAPSLEIGTDFGKGLSGKVDYLVSGEDSDGTISEVRVRFNNGSWEIYSNGTSFQKDIVPGANSLEAYAVDNKGAQSPIVTRSFESPTETEARAKIEEILNLRLNMYQEYLIEDVYSAPQDGINTILVDYNIETFNPPPKHDAIIGYISPTDSLNTELSNKQYLDGYSVPNLYLARLPLSEIESRLNSWIDNDWQ